MPSTPKKMTFIEAAQKNGFMKKGAIFKPLPKKGTTAYNKIKSSMK